MTLCTCTHPHGIYAYAHVYVCLCMCTEVGGSQDGGQVFLYSPLQKRLNRLCVEQGDALGERWRYMRLYKDAYYCFTEDDLDFTSLARECVDSCGASINCEGALRRRATGYITDDQKLPDGILGPSWRETHCGKKTTGSSYTRPSCSARLHVFMYIQ